MRKTRYNADISGLNCLIMSDRDATVAEITGSMFGLPVIVTGSSKRRKGDVADPEIGSALAMSRAFAKFSRLLDQHGHALSKVADAGQARVADQALRRKLRKRTPRAFSVSQRLTRTEIASEYGEEAAAVHDKRQKARRQHPVRPVTSG